jgi:hypothetical protein
LSKDFIEEKNKTKEAFDKKAILNSLERVVKDREDELPF